MKRKILSAVALLIAILCIPAAVAFAHSGGTDENGGHWDHSTGTYHYHHGYPAHQHPNGVCPYLDDAPEESSESSSPAIVYTSSTSSEDNTGPPITQAEAREMVQEASRRAYDQGRDDGREVGYESGYDEGYTDGYEEGFFEGISENPEASEVYEAYDEGYGMGYLEGSEEAMDYYYDMGYADGEAAGYDVGFEEAGTGVIHYRYLPADESSTSSQTEFLPTEQPNRDGSIREEVLWILLTAAVIIVLVLLKAYTSEHKERKYCEAEAENWRETAEEAQSELRRYKRDTHYILPLDD